MKRTLSALLCALLLALPAYAVGAKNTLDRETIWPKGKMPHPQEGQIAAMTDEVRAPGFDPGKHRTAYLQWFAPPAQPNGGCVMLISGGSYMECCDVGLIKKWSELFTDLGFQCVNFVYRTPRPQGLPIYRSAWEDAQRAVRLVRAQADRRGFDPEKIGAVSMSAGSHLALLMATSATARAYAPVDKLDSLACHLNWAIVHAPAYVTSDAQDGSPATRDGYGVDVQLSPVFLFDEKTCPMSLHHGGTDVYSPNGSTLVYRRLRQMQVPAELHLYPNVGHGAYGVERGVEFLKQLGFLGEPEAEVKLMDRYASDAHRASYVRQEVWPQGAMPNRQAHQGEPYLEWHFPKEQTTRAIQIIYSGGSYEANDPNGFEVAPARRFLNEKGMTVVTLKYRTPRPSANTGLAKHTTAWQDLQRTIRLVRSQAAQYGLDPEKIGIMGCSAGGHLTLMGATSSLHRSYFPIDEVDKLPCHVQWAIAQYPAYVLSDGADGFNATGGNSPQAVLVPDFSFDLRTCPTLFLHGDADPFSAMGSVVCWEKMRAMGVQSELHTLALRDHCFQAQASPGTGSYTWLSRLWSFISAQTR